MSGKKAKLIIYSNWKPLELNGNEYRQGEVSNTLPEYTNEFNGAGPTFSSYALSLFNQTNDFRFLYRAMLNYNSYSVALNPLYAGEFVFPYPLQSKKIDAEYSVKDEYSGNTRSQSFKDNSFSHGFYTDNLPDGYKHRKISFGSVFANKQLQFDPTMIAVTGDLSYLVPKFISNRDYADSLKKFFSKWELLVLTEHVLIKLRKSRLSDGELSNLVKKCIDSVGLSSAKKLFVKLGITLTQAANDAEALKDALSNALRTDTDVAALTRLANFLNIQGQQRALPHFDLKMILYDEYDRTINHIYPTSYSISQSKDNPNIIKWDVNAKVIKDALNDGEKFSTLGYNLLDFLGSVRVPEAEEFPLVGATLALRAATNNMVNNMSRAARVTGNYGTTMSFSQVDEVGDGQVV